MTKISEFKRSHPIIFSAIIILITSLFFIPIKLLYSLENAANIHCLIREIIVACFSVALVFITGQGHIYKCGITNLFKGLWSGFIFVALAGMGCSVFIADGIAAGREFKSVPEIAAFIVFVLFIGIAEESVCRGIVTDVLLAHFGKSKGGIWVTVLLSGLFFGLFHITNVFSQSIGETIIQMIATSMTGILLSAVYVRHKNIFAPMLLHALLDFMTMTDGGFFAGRSIIETASTESFDFWSELGWSLIAQGTFVVVAVFILRPKILKKIVEDTKNI